MSQILCSHCRQNIANSKANIVTIETIVCKTMGVDINKVYEKNRQRNIVICRAIIWYFARKIGWSLEALGRHSMMHHTSVINGLSTLNALMETDDHIYDTVDELKKILKNTKLKGKKIY